MPEDIIVSGGNSVEIEFPDSYTQQQSSPPRRKYKNNQQRPVRLLVNGQVVQDLGPRDKVTVEVDNDTGQTP